MGMFERLGEKVERLKQEAVAGREDSVEFRCRDCGEGFYSEPEACPECGSTEIARVESATEPESEAKAESASDANSESESETNTK
ncbi:zinc ribbon domain-containing protein [Natronolimnohabitans sp. A-GB9]|uniref:zinc ribbon domain-containing protein n=1 Tax=Natronolimnohabitans sp. A-GB9 TaxID=3069757 RepID=UPI0027AE7E71|nr:zinc ribbon domain-containing protein [Natronolimnohabitans sp. A-GB9]MDQ2049670.1 zinc ribbon domain-containing protein [Natronolimnohabitans sp. A-GB9]